MHQKMYYEKQQFTFGGKKGVHIKLKHRKDQKIILSGDLVTHTGEWEISAISRRVGTYVIGVKIIVHHIADFII